MAEDHKRTNAKRRARRNTSAARQHREQKATTDRQLVLDLDYLARTYGIDLLDFAEVRWDTGNPRLVLRGRRERA